MGCATAYFLAKSGVSVLLLEQKRIGAKPSASAASAALVEALAGNPLPLARQAQLSRRLLTDLHPVLREQTGIDFEWQTLGTIRLALHGREASSLRSHVAQYYEELGEETEWLDEAALRAVEPAVPDKAVGGLLVPASNGLYAPKYVRALAAGAAAHGAQIVEGVSVTGFEMSAGRVDAVLTSEGRIPCGQVVVASGSWTGVVSRWLGRPLPIEPQRGQVMALKPQPGQARVSHIIHGPGGYVIAKANGTAVVGATHEFAGFDARVTLGGQKFLADLAYRLVPGLEGAAVKHVWAGFRPVLMAEELPPVGRLPGLENAFVASGHGAIGVTVSAAVGLQLAQLMRGETPVESLAPFDPARVTAILS